MDAYTIADVAAALGVEHGTVRSYLARGQMPAPAHKLGRTPYWKRREIEPWLNARRRPATLDDAR